MCHGVTAGGDELVGPGIAEDDDGGLGTERGRPQGPWHGEGLTVPSQRGDSEYRDRREAENDSSPSAPRGRLTIWGDPLRSSALSARAAFVATSNNCSSRIRHPRYETAFV